MVWTLPRTDTACYRCATAVRHAVPSGRLRTDYATGRLAGEVGMGADLAAPREAAHTENHVDPTDQTDRRVAAVPRYLDGGPASRAAPTAAN